jgi:hypothetical protein
MFLLSTPTKKKKALLFVNKKKQKNFDSPWVLTNSTPYFVGWVEQSETHQL